MKKSFSQRQVTITLSGEEWFALCAELVRRPLSDKGKAAVREGKRKLSDQLTARADDYREEEIDA